MEVNSEKKNLKREMAFYFTFAAFMIFLNYLIQKTNQIFFAPLICQNFGNLSIIYTFYCSVEIYNMPELIGSIIAVGSTYILKFLLDKFIVFKKTETKLKETSVEFVKYFGFAIITTIENIGIQFLLTNFLHTTLEISFIVALSIGYLTKFILDRKFVFNKDYQNLKE